MLYYFKLGTIKSANKPLLIVKLLIITIPKYRQNIFDRNV